LHDKGHTQTDFNQTNERTGRNDNCVGLHIEVKQQQCKKRNRN